MSSAAQRSELQSQIWKIANEVRGSVDGWDFKQYVLGTLFYRFISENFSNYIEGGDESVNYAELDDKIITKEIIDDAIKTKGYFIYPSQLFSNIAKNANTNESLNTDLKAIFDAIENSASGYPSEKDIKGLFADFDTTSNRLGNTVKDKNARLAAVIKGIEGLDFGNFEDNQIDLFGDAYEYLISNYAANAGKSGGEFFTPQSVSKLIAKLATHGLTTINKIYDPAAGSGSLLLQAKKQFDNHVIQEGFFGQEINHTTYNLARMNMFLHNVNYDKFNIALGNTLTAPQFGDEKPFDAIVSNPPYSINWIGSDDPTLINDDRFAPAGVLAPKSKADFAFVLHCLSYLSGRGRAAIVCFPGIFYRGGAEQKIRKYLVDNNFVETVISLAPNLFYGTSIAVNILVLSKHKTDTKIQFIDASGEEFYKNKEKVMNETFQEYDKLSTNILANLNKAKDEVNKKKDNRLKSKEKINDILDNNIKEIEKLLKEEQDEKKTVASEDKIEKFILDIFNKNIGVPFETNEYQKIREEGNRRKNNTIPPGYKDKDKEENGDYYIFYSMMQKAKIESKDIIFVTDDEKEDWFNKYNGENHGGRSELLDEFYHETGQLLLMYTTDGFVQAYNKNISKKSINKSIIKEIKSYRNNINHNTKENISLKKVLNEYENEYLNFINPDNNLQFNNINKLEYNSDIIIRQKEIALLDAIRKDKDFQNFISNRIYKTYIKCKLKLEIESNIVDQRKIYNEIRQNINKNIFFINKISKSNDFELINKLEYLKLILEKQLLQGNFNKEPIINVLNDIINECESRV